MNRQGLWFCKCLLAGFYSTCWSALESRGLLANLGDERRVFQTVEVDLDVGQRAFERGLGKSSGHGEVGSHLWIGDRLEREHEARYLRRLLRHAERDAGRALQ